MAARSIITILVALMATADAAMALSSDKFGPMRWTGEEASWPQFKFEFTNWARRHGLERSEVDVGRLRSG